MKITLGIIKTDQSCKYHDELISSINDNIEHIGEIVYTGSREEIDFDDDIQIKCLNMSTTNKAVQRNAVLENSSFEYILWISNSCELDFDFISEVLEVAHEFPDANILYPNQVVVEIDGNESIIKYDDYYGRSFETVSTLRIDKVLPEYGVLTKKEIFEKFGNFDENFEDFEFYDFIFRNIKNLQMKQSKFSFVINRITDDFIDTSFHSKSIRENIKRYDLRELFPLLGWQKNEDLAMSTANYIIGDVLAEYYDLLNASDFLRKSSILFYNKISIQKLVEVYYKMGLFDEALNLLKEEHSFQAEELEESISKINQVRNLIENVEKAVFEGKVLEILNLVNDIYSVYQGAPVYNIIGVIEHMLGNKEKAFRFFYKAATLNPIADDIVQNLIDTAKETGNEEKVKNLFNRIVN